MATMVGIEKKTKDYSESRNVLAARVERLESIMGKVKRRLLPGIKSAVEATGKKYSELFDAIEESPELFEKPKTQTFHGVRVGYKKDKGKLQIDDESAAIKMIKKYFPDSWEVYIKVDEKPIKNALEKLPASDMKRLGIRVTDDTDEIFIKATDAEIEKLVNALLKSEEAEKAKEAA